MTVKMFADDVKIYLVVGDIDSSSVLQCGLDAIFDWSLKWQLSVSAKKCVMLQLGHSNKHFKGTLRRRLTYIFYRSVKSVIYHIFTYKVWTVNFYRKGPEI